MGIDNFFTLQTLLPGVQTPGAGKPLSAPVQVQGLGFIDIILTRFLENAKTQGTSLPAETTDSAPLQSGNSLFDKTPGLNLAELLAANAEIKEEVKNFITTPSLGLTAEQQLSQTLALNQKAFDDALKPLTDGIITSENVENGSPRILQALLIDTEKDRKGILNTLGLILDKLERLTQDQTGAGLALTNLTPEQITQLKAKIEALLANTKMASENADIVPVASTPDEKEDSEIAGIVLGLIKILPPQARPEVIVMPRGLIITPRPLEVASTTPTDATKPANDLSSKLNNMVSSGDAGAAGKENFDDLLKQFSGKKPDGAELNLAGKNNLQNMPSVKPDLSVLQNWPLAADGTLQTVPMPWSTDGLLPYTASNPASFTNAMTQASHASAPLPAMHMVAATLQKAAGDGQTRNFTLQLEPPELGRIEVRMNFARDKTVKAVVVAERPETLAMLQRDSHVLERALASAGLDADGSLSFELANDGHFGQDGGHDGNNGGHGGDADDGEIIQSTMNWYVDEATGHMRFNILA